MAEAQSIPLSKLAHCSGCSKPIWRNATNPGGQRCRECKLTHGASGYRRGCRCLDCRDGAAAKARAYSAQRSADGRPLHEARRRIPATCLACGCSFQARRDALTSGRGRYCSAECHNIFQTKTGQREREREYRRLNGAAGSVRRRAVKRSREAAAGTTGGNLVWVQGSCTVCANPFLSPGSQSRYCSRSCREKNRANRSYGLSWLDRMALFARDAWNCQICSEPVDYSADASSDWYPTLDHIVPRSHGGSDDVSNLRTAHRWCNSVRGDLSYYTDADLAA